MCIDDETYKQLQEEYNKVAAYLEGMLENPTQGPLVRAAVAKAETELDALNAQLKEFEVSVAAEARLLHQRVSDWFRAKCIAVYQWLLKRHLLRD